MSVLETFYILFKSDASDVKKGAEEAQKSTEKLAHSLQNIEKSSQHAGSSFLSFARAGAQLLAAYVGAGAILSTIKGNVDYVTQLGNASRALNVNSEDLEAWDYAAKRSGGTAEGFQHSLQSLSEKFGVTGQAALKTLPILADTFSRLSTFSALRYGKTLGLDENTILLLQKGRRELESVIQRQKELGVTKQKDIEITRQYNAALSDVAHAYRSLVNEFVTPILPYLTVAIDYLIEHKDVIVGAFAAIGTAGAIMAVKLALANKEIVGIAAAIAGIGVAYEDIKHFIKGDKETFLGDLVGVRKAGDVEKKYQSLPKGYTIPLPGFLQNLLPGGTPGTTVINKNLNVGDITINAEGQNPEGISDALVRTLNEHLQQANANIDNGINI